MKVANRFSAEEVQQLEQRALRLARTPGAVEPAERLITFRRGQTRYGVAAAELRGVRPLPRLTRLPWSAPHLLGVVNIDGHTLGALDLERLEKPGAPAPASPWSLWLTVENRGVLLVADEMLDVVDVPRSQLSAETRGAFAGRLAGLVRTVLAGPLLVLAGKLLLNPELYRPVER